ncbi:hypothetical protein PCC9214_02827 [Planktothrix tepida]|uniref:Uncharacterized protein n=1 Tax=Planktothrix pseudagardhii TaxID=132604 RepID=A0A9W4D6W9_9CYAN|nr:hypothetical protein NO713_02830 [Planktothrix pseudagardhii]CAD5955373.1 hypothetical protein PCC9214_02827 [Planktothrix tepida]
MEVMLLREERLNDDSLPYKRNDWSIILSALEMRSHGWKSAFLL